MSTLTYYPAVSQVQDEFPSLHYEHEISPYFYFVCQLPNSSWFSFSCWTMKRPSDWMISRLVLLQLQESGIPVLRGRNIELVPLFCHQCLRDFSLMAITHFWLSFLLFPAFLVQNGSFTLVVNIKSKDGEIVQQTFSADPEKDFVTIDYKSNENRFVSVYIDFRQVCVKASLLKIFF